MSGSDRVWRVGDYVRVVTEDGAEFFGAITDAQEHYFTLAGCPPELIDHGLPIQNYGFCYEDVELHPG